MSCMTRFFNCKGRRVSELSSACFGGNIIIGFFWVASTNKTDCHNITEIIVESGINVTNCSVILNVFSLYLFEAKIKKLFVSHTRPTVRKCCDSKYFLGDLRQLFFCFFVTGNRDRKFRYCSRIYAWNWFTLLNEQNPLLDFEGTRFVNELCKKKNPPTYRPIGEMEGGVRETNIFLRVA